MICVGVWSEELANDYLLSATLDVRCTLHWSRWRLNVWWLVVFGTVAWRIYADTRGQHDIIRRFASRSLCLDYPLRWSNATGRSSLLWDGRRSFEKYSHVFLECRESRTFAKALVGLSTLGVCFSIILRLLEWWWRWWRWWCLTSMYFLLFVMPECCATSIEPRFSMWIGADGRVDGRAEWDWGVMSSKIHRRGNN